MPKVSIIIPFNNVEKYINQCLDSVVNQTLSDVEIICVDDASDDGTLDIVKGYANKDNRIKLIELSERKGQGYARNRALEVATGEYIGFVDSDDFVHLNMFEALYNKAIENDCEIVMCKASEYDDETGKYIHSDYYSLECLANYPKEVFNAEETKEHILDINIVIWNKIYKREYLKEIGGKFPEGFVFEDLPFFFGTYLPAKRISIVWEDFYSYRINRKNSTMLQFNNKLLDRPYMVSLTYEKIKNSQYLDEKLKEIQGWIINDLFHRFSLLEKTYQKEYFFLMKKVFKTFEIEDIEAPCWKKVYHFENYLLVLNNSYEEFMKRVVDKYTNIHKIEDKIVSMISTMVERTELSGTLEKICSNFVQDLVNMNNATDAKISKVYEEITNNYKYTEKLVEDVKNSGLSGNTKEKIDLFYTNLKDLSYVVHENENLLNDKLYKLEQVLTDKISFEKEETKKFISNLLKELTQQISDEILQKQKENKNELRKIEDKLNELNSKFDSYINEEKLKQKFQELENKYLSLLEEQNYRHNEEMMILKEQLIQAEQNLSEKLETPCRKIHNYIAGKKK